ASKRARLLRKTDKQYCGDGARRAPSPPHERRARMASTLSGRKVAVLAVDGFEQAELIEPKRALAEAGATVHVISAKPGTIQGFKHVDKGEAVEVDSTFDEARPDDYDAVVLPGGVVNGDAIRLLPQAQAFVKAADSAKKPIA